MFIHAVLFKIKPKFAKTYIKDCKMWASEAKKAAGVINYKTIKRVNQRNQFASVYCWKSQRNHVKFMKANHEALVKRSKAPVKVLGYFNFKTIDEIVSRK